MVRFVKHIDSPRLTAGELSRFGDDRVQHGLQIERRIDRLTDLAERPQLLNRACELGGALSNQLFKLLGRLFAFGQEPIKRDCIVAKYFDSASHLSNLVIAANGNRNVATPTYNRAHSSRKRGKPRDNIPPDIEPHNKDGTDDAERNNCEQRSVAKLLD